MSLLNMTTLIFESGPNSFPQYDFNVPTFGTMREPSPPHEPNIREPPSRLVH